MAVDPAQFDEELQQLLIDLNENPSNVELIARICYDFNIRSFHNLCIFYARKGLAMDPYHAGLFHELIVASTLDTAHILDEIQRELEQILAERPGDMGARRNLALVHYFMENDEEAQAALTQIVKQTEPSQVDRLTYEVLAQLEYTRENFEDCIAYCDEAAAKPGNAARTTRLKGLCFQEMGDTHAALEAFQQALELEPHFVWACHSLGTLFFEKGDYQQAFRFFGKAAFVNPRDPGNLFLLAEAFMDIEAFDNAISELQKLLMTRPEQRIEAEVHNALGFLFMKKGERNQAREHLIQAIELEPELSVAYYNMGLLAHQESNFHLAERHFKNALEVDPHHVDSWVELGFMALAGETEEDAEDCFEAALDLDPDHAQAYLGLSKVCQQNKAYKAQLENALRAVELDPDHAEIHNNLGIAYECSQDYENAETAYVAALELDPYLSAAANNLGYIYERFMQSKPDEEALYRKKAIATWKMRLQICVERNKSTKAAVSHLKDLGLTDAEIDAAATLPYDPV